MTDIKKIAVVLSVFHFEICSRLKEGVLAELKKNNIEDFEIKEVSGVIEIPLIAQQLFQKKYQSVIALGCVIRGETDHYDSCCRMVEQGCMQVQLKANKPLIFGVLMVHTKQQALDRTGGTKGHISCTAVQVALKMIGLAK